MKPHKPGEYMRRARRQPKPVAAKKPAIAKHAAKPKAKPGPRKRRPVDQTAQFTGVATKRFTKKEEAAMKRPGFRVTPLMLARARGNRKASQELARQIFAAARPMPGVVPKGKATIAMDENIELTTSWAAQSIYNGAFQQGVVFMGYPYLAELAQRAEYRRVSEVIASEMTRKWIEIKCHSSEPTKGKLTLGDEAGEGGEGKKPEGLGQDALPANGASAAMKLASQPSDGTAALPDVPSSDRPVGGEAQPDRAKGLAKIAELLREGEEQEKDERVKALEDEFERLGVQGAFRELAEQDGFFGRSHLYVHTKTAEGNDNELKVPIGNGQDPMSALKIKPGELERIKTVEAIWCYPANYNAFNPLATDWYRPAMWFVMGKEVHASRLLTFIGREVPDMLKPAYSFGGLALSQMVQPCVQNWLRTRQSVSDIIHSFSVFVLKTNMGMSLQEDGDEVFGRADFFNAVRDNRGLMMIDKESEEFANVSAPLGSLDKLQAQSQEHICSVSGIPLVKYTGISPSGLNASSDGEIRVFYDWIAAYQKSFFLSNLTRIFHLAQLNLWGKVDPDLYFEFVKLHELTPKEEAEVRKVEADTDVALVGAGVLQPEESRDRLSKDVTGPYAGIDVNDVPTPPAGEDPLDQRGGFDPNQELDDGEGTGEEGDDVPPGKKAPAVPSAAVAQPEV